MSVITPEQLDVLTTAANGIADEKKRNNALALLTRMTEVIEGVGDNPITWRPTMIRVLQAMSKMDDITGNAKPGALVAGNEVIPNGTLVIPLMTWTSRSMWDSNNDSGRKLCSSPDGKFGWAHGECNKCPFSRSEEGIPPCNKEQSFLVMDADFRDMYRLTFHKSQYRDGLEWSKMIGNSRTHPFKRVYALSGVDLEKNKKIKTLKATLQDVRTGIPADELAFLEAMYTKQLDDRKSYLISYRDQVIERTGSKGPALTHDKSDTPALTHSAEDDGTPNYNL